MKPKIAFFDTKSYDKTFFLEKNQQYGFEIKFYKSHLNKDNAILAKGADVVCIFVNAEVDANVIDILVENGVKLIALRCAGYNNVDLKAAKNRIKVVRVPAYSPHSIAEYTLALMLTLNRKIHRAYNRTREGNFALEGLMGFEMIGKTAGIIGTENRKIGAQILKSMGINVLAYDLYPDMEFAKNGIRYASLDELYQNSISFRFTAPDQRNRVPYQRRLNRKMKEGVMIINTGRGKLINTKDLIDGLKDKKIGSAGLDVYEEESDYFYEDHSDIVIDDDILARLLTFNNVIVTSHQAFFTKEALSEIARITLQNIQDFFDGKPLVNEVLA